MIEGKIEYKGIINGIKVYHDNTMQDKLVYVGYKQILTNYEKEDITDYINDLTKPLPKIKHLTF